MYQLLSGIRARGAAGLCLLLGLAAAGGAQETLKSGWEDYCDFLSLQGLAARPALNYRTLSDSVWDLGMEAGEKGPWRGLKAPSPFTFAGGLLSLRVYGPELFQSYNTAAPYGQNDGALWQGRGYNASVTAGVRLEAGNTRFGRVEATLKPLLAFSQNTAFDYIAPNAAYADFTGKAADYGYYGVASVDAPQRFGDAPFFTFDWGDSEIRYTWKTLTAGIGTQAVWLGPAQINPIIHSNNAPTYPKLDIGLRRQRVTLPLLGWHLGDVEARAWWGYLSESDWFDNDADNDHNLTTGLSVDYAFPGWLSGLTVGFNRTMLSKWDAMNADAIFTLMLPFIDSDAGSDENDQRASFTVDYLFPKTGFDIYFEYAINDYLPSSDYVVRFPFHTGAYTFGAKKAVSITNNYALEILLEVTDLTCSPDYDRLITWYSTFYAHHIITQGYTNRGQWLGAGIGTGGNSQYLGLKLYYPKGYAQVFAQRRNPDFDYSMFIDTGNRPNDAYYHAAWRGIRAFLDFGLEGMYFAGDGVSLTASFVFRDEHNPLYISEPEGDSIHRYNCYFALGARYTL